MKRVFSDKEKYAHFVRDNVTWILEKYNYDFAKDEVKGFLGYVSKMAAKLTSDSK